ncbi:hypothetical protein KC359_g238 [Hortaea werneckii]|nr:hypothetical protein KC359_g238 [Hortaea werneckii]
MPRLTANDISSRELMALPLRPSGYKTKCRINVISPLGPCLTLVRASLQAARFCETLAFRRAMSSHV